MNRLRTKTSQFFKNGPTQDEKVAITPTEQEFDAGIERGMKKKPSRFFRKQNDKTLLSPPYVDPFEGPPPPLPKDHDHTERAGAKAAVVVETSSKDTDKPLPSRPNSCLSASPTSQTTPDGACHRAACKTKQADLKLKKRPSLASLRKSGSRIFRANAGDHYAPPPPMPQIPIDTPTPKLRRPLLRPAESNRSSRSSQSSKARVTSISRPIPSAQFHVSPDSDPTHNHPCPNPNGPRPRPPRPARPGSVDKDLVAMARDSVARMMIHTPNRARTLTASTASSAWPPALSRVGSEVACSRLDLPSGHSSLSPPRSPIFDSPLAANFPMDPSMPLPFRDSDGSVLGYGRFSAYVKARQGYASGGYADGVEEGDRDSGPVEMYCRSRCADWTLEKRVSGDLGERGMLFRDRWGGWHLVRDI